nr:hypothetical protein [uncultured Acidocella sp.]
MITMRRQLLGLGFVAGSSLLAMNAAHALNGPTAINIDGGPLGSLSLSGGFDAYGFAVSGMPAGGNGSNTTNVGTNVGSAIIQLQKTTGELQFNIEIGSVGGSIAPGTVTSRPGQTSVSTYVTGPLYEGYVTLAPKDMPFTISAGQLGSLEGYEASLPWFNPSQLVTSIFYVQNSSARGVEANYTKGPFSATVEYGDGWDTGVFNFVQALGTYTIDPNNVLNVYYAGNVGRQGLTAKTYSNTSVASYGPYFMNSQMFGAYYSFTAGNLNLVPEVQYVYAHTNHQLGIDKTTANLGAALFGNYTFGKSPYSLGGWVEYENSQGAGSWFVGPKSEGVGFALAPTWQYKDLYARVNAGGFYLLNNKYQGVSYGYGTSGTDKFQFVGTLEGGVLF